MKDQLEKIKKQLPKYKKPSPNGECVRDLFTVFAPFNGTGISEYYKLLTGTLIGVVILGMIAAFVRLLGIAVFR
jgi:hypothetical protein